MGTHGQSIMLSRVASSIYWMCRFIERADNYARFMDVNLNLTLDLPPDVSEQWRPLVKTTGDSEIFKKKYSDEYRKEDVIRFFIFDRENENSIFSCLSEAREEARTVREIISSEMWQQINELYLAVQDGMSTDEDLGKFFRKVKLGSHLFNGIMEATFSHTEGWHFGRLGRFMERADKTARIVDMKYFYLLPSPKHVGTPLDLLQWSALLKSASAYEMYRKTYGKLDSSNIIKFLVLDRSFPRAIHHCLVEAEQSLRTISGTEGSIFESKAEKELGKLRAELEYTDLEDILKNGAHEYLDNFQKKLNKVGDAVSDTFFTFIGTHA